MEAGNVVNKLLIIPYFLAAMLRFFGSVAVEIYREWRWDWEMQKIVAKMDNERGWLEIMGRYK